MKVKNKVGPIVKVEAQNPTILYWKYPVSASASTDTITAITIHAPASDVINRHDIVKFPDNFFMREIPDENKKKKGSKFLEKTLRKMGR